MNWKVEGQECHSWFLGAQKGQESRKVDIHKFHCLQHRSRGSAGVHEEASAKFMSAVCPCNYQECCQRIMVYLSLPPFQILDQDQSLANLFYKLDPAYGEELQWAGMVLRFNNIGTVCISGSSVLYIILYVYLKCRTIRQDHSSAEYIQWFLLQIMVCSSSPQTRKPKVLLVTVSISGWCLFLL